MIKRKVWNGQDVPALGLGCWAIGGPFFAGATALGWGEVDDTESARAIAAAVDGGIRFFDTAPAYGTGHSESILGKALQAYPEVMISTKIGYGIDPATKQLTGEMISSADVETAVDGSLRRLRRDTIDIVFLHLNSAPVERARELFEALQRLRERGKVSAFGWSTDYPDRADAMHDLEGFVAVQHAMNVLFKAEALVPVLEKRGLFSINRSPLAMGVLSGRYSAGHRFSTAEIRGQNADWLAYFKEGKIEPETARMFGAVRDLLQSDRRTLVQGAIAWLWARSGMTIPIPGFRTEQQVKDLCGALTKGPLKPEVFAEIERVIVRPEEGPPRDR
jgi:aryl-alcohol dehydrogenase-like predicted oxidoreductase